LAGGAQTVAVPGSGRGHHRRPGDPGVLHAARPHRRRGGSDVRHRPADDKGAEKPAQPNVKASSPADDGQDAGAGGDDGKDGKDGGQAAQASQVPGTLPELEKTTGAQAQGGSLAETGAQLWPAAVGGVLVIFGFFVLRSVRRSA